jgi:type II secretion system protein N
VKRVLTIAGVVLLVALLVTAMTFPTDAIVRSIVQKIPLPNGLQIQFAHAYLRPNGLRLEDVRVVRLDGKSAFDALSLHLRPSLWGLWGNAGRPWTIAAETCQGTVELTTGAAPSGRPLSVTLRNVELATCLPYAFPNIQAYGRVEGEMDFAEATGGGTVSKGTLTITSASWTPGGPLEDDAIKADTGAITWRFANSRLEFTKIAASSEDFQATGSGIIRVLSPVDTSPVEIRMEVTPGRTMPATLREYFDAIQGSAPTTKGTRTFTLQGPLRDARLVGAPGRE